MDRSPPERVGVADSRFIGRCIAERRRQDRRSALAGSCLRGCRLAGSDLGRCNLRRSGNGGSSLGGGRSSGGRRTTAGGHTNSQSQSNSSNSNSLEFHINNLLLNLYGLHPGSHRRNRSAREHFSQISRKIKRFFGKDSIFRKDSTLLL